MERAGQQFCSLPGLITRFTAETFSARKGLPPSILMEKCR